MPNVDSGGDVRSASEVVTDLEAGVASISPVATGFWVLDRVLEGGLSSRDLTVLGGIPGSGKTAMALQWARNMASDGHQVVYACYDHDDVSLLGRLLMLEIGDLTGGSAGSSLQARAQVGTNSLVKPARNSVPRGYMFGPWNLSVADSADPKKNKWLANGITSRIWDPVSGQVDFKKQACRIEKV